MIFANYNPQSWIKMCRSFFDKLGNFFSAEIRKLTFVIFETNVSSRKPCVWASKASFAQKLQEFCRQNFISSRELRTGKIPVVPGFCGIEHRSSSMPVV